MFDISDEELPTKSNIPPGKVATFAMMEMKEAAFELDRVKPLSRIHREAFMRFRIGQSGKSREEIVRVTHGPMKEEGAEDDLS